MRASLARTLLLLVPPLRPEPVPPRIAPAAPGVVVVVSSSLSESARDAVQGFRRRMEQRGVRVGADLNVTNLDDAAALNAVRASRADIVLAVGSRAQDVSRRAAPQSQIVSALTTTPQEPGSTRSTGVSLEFAIDQQLQWIRRILPSSQKRIGIVYSPTENEQQIAKIREAARSQNLEIIARPVQSPADIPAALASLSGSADVLWGVPDDMVMTPETARSILLFSLRSRLPLIGLSSAWVKSGALFALDRDYADLGMQCAEQALRLLGGESAQSVPPERPRKLVYAINQRTADLMSVRFTSETLRNAREVVR
jgi:putative tryptophan/tyrosine transport system substrate-binding protein